MPRRPTPIGHYGNINVKHLGKKQWLAEGRVRDRDGESVRVRRTGPTKGAAEAAFKEAAEEIAKQSRGAVLGPDTRVTKLIDLWLADLDQNVSEGSNSKNTRRQFHSYVKNWVRPGIGSLTIRELKVGRIDALISRVYEKRGPETAASIRAVLSLICGFAVRNEVMDSNPVRSAKRRKRSSEKEVVALNLTQRRDLKQKLVRYVEAKQIDKLGRTTSRARVWLDLADLMDAMLATGTRIGEILAMKGVAFDPESKTVRVEAHIIREKGEGLIREQYRKGATSGDKKILILTVPDWSLPMWRRRRMAAGEGPMFPGFRGDWQDPVAVIHRLREVFDACGYEWVTSHVWRKTVGAVLTEAGLNSGVVADQLGNSRLVAERHYIPPRVSNGPAAAALEAVYDQGEEAG
jgi:integrase